MAETAEIPLFPLGTVLFPQQVLPLRIFEERYKRMIGRCLEENIGFGVVLIRQGREVGGPSVPFEVGTLAKIVDAQIIEGGRYNLKTVGDQPFRLLRVTEQRPYMQGEVELLSYEPGETAGLEAIAESVKKQFDVHLNILSAMSGQERPQMDMNVDPEGLSYLVASMLLIKMPEKQALLELPRADERLRAEAAILARENRALQTFLYLKQQEKSRLDPGDLQGRISLN